MSLKGMLVEKLQTAFGDYVEGITAENLKMQVMAGLIEQRDLPCAPRRSTARASHHGQGRLPRARTGQGSVGALSPRP